ncbi:toll/interleukin-1 receptor domain-containing protein [Pseudomonas sp. NY15435]|uniref:toll/interleukin-1 receptor domain-containing protein n=1 Tax=Pseudomonas sp. NY15435 TaxID=3400358 RepID=UPI003A84741E
MDSPKVFISYSHDSQEHKDWVYRLACDLVKRAGIEVVLDQWDLELGSNLPRFMHDAMNSADRVLVVCTDPYIQKSNGAKGGAGYEGAILTAELFRKQDSNKYIPLIRSATGDLKVPDCLDGRLYTDFSRDDDYEARFTELKHEIYGVPLRPKPKRGKNPFEQESDSRPRMNMADDHYFGMRFGETFPGLRSIQYIDDPVDASLRLCHLLKEPLVFQDGTPFWWWRHGNLHISSFGPDTTPQVLMNIEELRIRKIAAVYSSADYRKFIYVECDPSPPSGANEVDHDWQMRNKGYVSEEFAVFEGRNISVAEAEDGATLIDGSPVSVRGKTVYRKRYLTRYNFVIAPCRSSINNPDFDNDLERILNSILDGSSAVEDLEAAVRTLPKPSR